MLRKQTEELYWIMRRDGVISEAEYRRALQTGSISDPNQAQALREPGKSPPPQRSVRTGGTARIRTIIGNTLPARERPVPGGRVRTRFRTASRAYTNVLATIRECVRQQDAADVADALSRRRRAEAWAREHGVARRQIAPDGVISIIHDIDDYGIPRIMGGNALADAQFVKADELWPTATNGYALSGSNITVAVWETGQIRTTHGEFQGRATQVHTNEGFTSTDHATAMAGIIAAAGLDISYNVDGILYNGNVNGYDCEQANSDLTIMNGTSPACAIAAGVVAQLVQLDEQINGTNEPLWASTYKALVVHTAEKGSSYSIGPDYRQGYGLINARAAVDLLMTDSLYSAPQHVFEVVVATNVSDAPRFYRVERHR
jgi:hypothetical protein